MIASLACDSALRDKSWIASRVLQLHTPSMRPCTRSQSPDFSSQILESLGLSLESSLRGSMDRHAAIAARDDHRG
ncbi:hypothetical protein [Helicobacter canis]|uniref:hypothetical protein n=1 Tax=Helicobacter canis TaxID=29419 RepID=UPI0011C017E8|nr:hypothetical protein [Helicobacter canis]